MAFEYRFNAITFYPKNEPLRFAPPETSKPFRFKNSSGWFCGLYTKMHDKNHPKNILFGLSY